MVKIPKHVRQQFITDKDQQIQHTERLELSELR